MLSYPTMTMCLGVIGRDQLRIADDLIVQYDIHPANQDMIAESRMSQIAGSMSFQTFHFALTLLL